MRRDFWMRGALAAALVAMLLWIPGCGERTEDLVIVNTEKEANRILVELANQGIMTAQKVERTAQRKTAWAVTVAASELGAARGVLVRFDLPREEKGGFEAMLSQGGLIPTRSDERAKLMYAMASELERTFEVYDRVLKARVHIVLPEKDLLDSTASTRPTTSATVLIKYKAEESSTAARPVVAANAVGDPPDVPVGREQITRMVARGTEGLLPENVEVAYERVYYPKEKVDLEQTNQRLAERLHSRETMLWQLMVACCAFAVAAVVLVVIVVRGRQAAAGHA